MRVVMLEGIIKIWFEALSLDLNCCKRSNNIWYWSGVTKPIFSDSKPSWFCSLLLEFAFWFLNLNWGSMLCIACINHMSYFSTMNADFRNISFSTSSSFVNINHCFRLITKNLSLLLCIKRTNHIQGWQGVSWEIIISVMSKFIESYNQCFDIIL